MRLQALLIAVVVSGLLLPGCIISKPENRPPTAVFVASSSAVNAGQKIILDAANSTDKDGKIVRYHWTFGDLTEDLGVSVEHTFGAGGNYTVTLTVTDNEGKKDRTNMTVRINEYPRARIDCSSPEAKVNAQVTFSAANSTDSDGTIVKCTWGFGDGINASGMSVNHNFGDVGTYTVNLTVTDDFGATNSRSMDINVILRTYDISWNLLPQSLPQISEYGQENTTTNKTVALLFTNMTTVEFKLTWRDDICHFLLGKYNDDFSLRVADPSNNSQLFKDMTGNITLSFSLAESPGPLTIRAKTAAEAACQIGPKYQKSLGMGNWTAQIVLGNCDGAQQIIGEDIDLGNSWKLDVKYVQYEMVVTEK